VQHYLNDIGRWDSRSRIKINSDKSSAITFSRGNKINVPKLTLNKEQMDYVQECRYLGVHLHRRRNWNGHCQAMRTLGKLVPLLKSSLPQKFKLLLYKSYVQSQMTYASPAWAFITKTQFSRLQVVQNGALRIIGGYDIRTTDMHFDHKIPLLKSYVKTLALKMYASAKINRIRYVRTFGSASTVLDPRVPRPLHILS
jgi:hypothetical protein